MTFTPDQAIAVPDDSDPSVPPSATAVHRVNISQFFTSYHRPQRSEGINISFDRLGGGGQHQHYHTLPATLADCYTKIMAHCALEEMIRTFVRFGTLVAKHD